MVFDATPIGIRNSIQDQTIVLSYWIKGRKPTKSKKMESKGPFLEYHRRLYHCGLKKGERFLLGRDPSANIILTDSQASRKHAELSIRFVGKKKRQVYVLKDLGSTNGTFVNDKKVDPKKPIALKSGDQIKLGKEAIEFQV